MFFWLPPVSRMLRLTGTSVRLLHPPTRMQTLDEALPPFRAPVPSCVAPLPLARLPGTPMVDRNAIDMRKIGHMRANILQGWPTRSQR
ncbi:uncharacterized protein PHACADRAFT_261893 [Phanerochaete carnosa HHB-10118-sp]|uniref:Uncharacterized protein n=1 Tax=Phanerochaete carnosa (strain HHB-10118-sp) TaxID=650164 RepID=K5VXT5_PHACS|nr:uncharacterized protein PHACADRAFT_261893 [Phanerochaete carnosa HHB-10118-sp]EKM51640.1 hypothetical protein PHACADRAFT_261893 [Phanerochaete carnosa HHB-10118-sp]